MKQTIGEMHAWKAFYSGSKYVKLLDHKKTMASSFSLFKAPWPSGAVITEEPLTNAH